MKILALLSVIAVCATIVQAQDEAPNKSVAHSISSVTVAMRRKKVSLATLRVRGQATTLFLRARGQNLNRQITMEAMGTEHVLLRDERGQVVMPLSELQALYTGEALVPLSPSSAALLIENAVQVVPITALGEDAEVMATYMLHNRSNTPLNVTVASTSCGCTAAILGRTHLEAGEKTTLRATMHADDERMVTVSLQTNDVARPIQLVALQSKRAFEPFALPTPVSLFGENGEVVKAQTYIELPVGWRVGRLSSTPSWLRAELKAEEKAQLLRLEVTAPVDAPAGRVQGRVSLELLGAPLKNISVPVGGFISNDVTITPPLITLGAVGTGVARRTIIVHGPQPFSIRGVRSDEVGFKASVDLTVIARSHAVELLVPVGGALGDTISQRVTLDLSDGRELAIDIYGTLAIGRLPAVASGITLGQSAPNFHSTDGEGKVVSLSQFLGKHNVLLTFFPHCFTGGCASHLASLRDVGQALAATGTQIVAVSTDDAAQVRAFATQLHLPFPVLSDTRREVALGFGAVQTPADAPSRLSFLIDRNGIVRFIDTAINVKTHGADMLARIRELGLK